MNGDQEHDVQEPRGSCSALSMRRVGSGVCLLRLICSRKEDITTIKREIISSWINAMVAI